MIKIVSFDLDGTLTKQGFADRYWLEALPLLYAREKDVSVDEAKKLLFCEYDKVGKERLEWYDPSYWFKRFDIKYSWKKLIFDCRDAIEVYPDVLPTLERLTGKYKLIVVSNAKKEFIEIQLKETGLNRFFTHVFSSVSDFGMIKKKVDVYRRVCSIVSVDEKEVVHVGDDKVFDYETPRSIGIKAFYVDREKKTVGENVIYSLSSLPSILSRYEE